MSNSFYHKDLTDSQWKKINFLFPKPKSVGRPALNHRKVRYYEAERVGVIYRLVTDIGTVFITNSVLIEIDSTFCKVHQSACSTLKNQAIDSSRGGKNTKIHVLVNERMQLLNVVLTGEQIHDSEKVVELFEGVTLKGKSVLGDIAFSSEKIRDYIEKEGGKVCIPDKSNFKIQHDFDKELYKQRSIVERFFQRIKNFRHIATRYDKLADCFLPLLSFNFNLPTTPRKA